MSESDGVAADKPPCVLIVEDEYFVASELEYSLLAAGFAVCGIAASADEALSLALSEHPELVLMDIRLLGPRDGIAAAIDIYQQTGIRSIFATAHVDEQTKARAEPAAPLGWIAKPYTSAMVIRLLHQHLPISEK
jgi:CheY-like chemotaxis protein